MRISRNIDATPSTGLIGPAPDVARFLMAILNGGTLNRAQILSPESISRLIDSEPLDGWGLGWAVGESDSERYLEHMGGGPGFATTLRIYPESGVGIAILANGTDFDRQGLANLLGKVAPSINLQ